MEPFNELVQKVFIDRHTFIKANLPLSIAILNASN